MSSLDRSVTLVLHFEKEKRFSEWRTKTILRSLHKLKESLNCQLSFSSENKKRNASVTL